MTKKNIFILTGAGISAPSGIKTFRDSNGLWNGHNVEEVATPEGFANNPTLVYDFYNQRRAELYNVKPNKAHSALSILNLLPYVNLTLVTQNVDDLHERGGIQDLVHMHGELRKVRCLECHNVVPWHQDLTAENVCPKCNGQLRPHIVWFGEMPFGLDLIESALKRCDIFLCIGTSGQVAPASQFVNYAKNNGAHTIEFNLEDTAISTNFDECIAGDIEQTLPIWIQSML